MTERPDPPDDDTHAGDAGDSRFIRHALAFYGIGAVLLLGLLALWFAAHVLLLIFASILVAIFLHKASCVLARRLPLSRPQSLAIVMALVLALLGIAGYVLVPRVARQSTQLWDTLPAALQGLQGYFTRYEWMRDIVRTLPSIEKIFSDASTIMNQARTLFSNVLGAIGSLLLIFFLGIYLAAQPHVYIKGFLALLPKPKRARAQALLDELGNTLAHWMIGKFLAMVIVGLATGTGLYLLGVPLAITLGVIAGLLDFIPYLGPILAGIPAVLIAFTHGPVMALYVMFLILAVQLLESYLLTPLVERRAVSLPPALTISMQVLLGLPFGLIGVALATPLTAALFVVVTMLYVHDVLGDRIEPPRRH
ncbi:AI-2E family transporter [Massilia glaciei]|uniref:AI-2E family transporter n=1 Tax=Massilia glaciei TaxID=1524097 RepID=A0A2U2HM22_9BURK|nr:AI-2E family transporter [Massilia glaciei]PWF48482.1 AI-2E family transporter [Massilia glaciei]